MNKLLSSNFSRLQESKLFWLGMAFMFLAGTALVLKQYKQVVMYGYPVKLESTFFSYTLLILVVSAIFCLSYILSNVMIGITSEVKRMLVQPEYYYEDALPLEAIAVNGVLEESISVYYVVLNNAVKYSDGDLTITLSDSGKITFSNHAASLSETQVAKLFDRFSIL